MDSYLGLPKMVEMLDEGNIEQVRYHLEGMMLKVKLINCCPNKMSQATKKVLQMVLTNPMPIDR